MASGKWSPWWLLAEAAAVGVIGALHIGDNPKHAFAMAFVSGFMTVLFVVTGDPSRLAGR